MAETELPSVRRLAAVAALVHFAADSLCRLTEATTPAYLLTPYMKEVFRDMLGMLGLTAVSGVTSFVNGLISAIFATALAGVATRRAVKLSVLLAFIGLFSGGLTFFSYLEAPAGLVATSLLAGLPRAALLGWLLDRSLPKAEAPTSTTGAAA